MSGAGGLRGHQEERSCRPSRVREEHPAYHRRYEVWAEKIEELLTDGPLAASDIRKRLAPGDDRVGEALKYVTRLMAAEGRTVAATTTGTWRSNRFTYARWDDWLPGVAREASEPERELAHRCFAAYTPATGRGLLLVERHTPATGEGVRRGPSSTRRATFGGLRSAAAASLGQPPHGPPGPVSGSRSRARRIRLRQGRQCHLDVLLDGRVAGVWHLEDTPEKVVVKVAPLTARLERRPRQIEAEAMRTALMLGVAKLEVHLVGPPPSLRIGPRNLFLSTLKDR